MGKIWLLSCVPLSAVRNWGMSAMFAFPLTLLFHFCEVATIINSDGTSVEQGPLVLISMIHGGECRPGSMPTLFPPLQPLKSSCPQPGEFSHHRTVLQWHAELICRWTLPLKISHHTWICGLGVSGIFAYHPFLTVTLTSFSCINDGSTFHSLSRGADGVTKLSNKAHQYYHIWFYHIGFPKMQRELNKWKYI